MILYHGGAEEIAHPDLTHSRKAVDFGAGFYVTPIYDQAKRWSEKRKRRNGAAVISRYEFDESATSNLKVLRFESYSEPWLDFIVKCRALEDDSDWDIVSGGVANDKVFDTLEAFFDGFATKAQTIDRLRMETPNMQLCFRTAAALRTLRFIGSEWI
jgi:hypothetical protein